MGVGLPPIETVATGSPTGGDLDGNNIKAVFRER